jgi:hypothetical protein
MASKSTQDEDDSEEVEEQEQEQEDEEHDEDEQEQEQAESDADSDVAEALGFSLHAFLGRALTEDEARVLSESRAPGGDRSKLHPLAIDGLPPLLSDTTELAELRPDADADAFAGIKDSVRALWDESYGTPTEQQAAIFTLMQRHVDMLMPVCTGENEDGLLPVRATATRQRSAPYRHRHHRSEFRCTPRSAHACCALLRLKVEQAVRGGRACEYSRVRPREIGDGRMCAAVACGCRWSCCT